MGLRLVEFLVGAGVGPVAAVASEWVAKRLAQGRTVAAAGSAA